MYFFHFWSKSCKIRNFPFVFVLQWCFTKCGTFKHVCKKNDHNFLIIFAIILGFTVHLGGETSCHSSILFHEMFSAGQPYVVVSTQIFLFRTTQL
uniref:Uncharacterized protein n=1 Tax=Triticum urartu TaxID=4572 RepID=A0A8R7QLQ5_TRIUA